MLGHMVRNRRMLGVRALWRAWREHGRAGRPGLGERLTAVPRLVRDTAGGRYPGMGRLHLAGIVLAVLYLVSPVDVVPELLVGLLGLGDDAVVALWLAGTFVGQTQRYLYWERTGRQL